MNFEKSFLDEQAWLRQADQFLDAACVLAEGFAVPRPALPLTETELTRRVACLKGTLLLLAVSVENALKAIRVAQGAVIITNGKVQANSFGAGNKGHGLVQLAEVVGLDASDQEKVLLERLTTIATWAGKYQQPLSEDAFMNAEAKNPRTINYSSDIDLARSLITKSKRLVAIARARTVRLDP